MPVDCGLDIEFLNFWSAFPDRMARLRVSRNNETQDRRRKPDVLMQIVNQMVSVAFDLKPVDLLDNERGRSRNSRARQIAMYLMHVMLSRSFMEIADYYGRDRSTVSHACNVVEELRDIPSFDDHLLEFEKTILLVMSLTAHTHDGSRHG